MVRLILVRHAIAGVRDGERWPDDRERPLTARGIRRFESAAAGLGALEPRVDALLTSPWTRAMQTAAILEDVAGWPEPEVRPHLAGDAPVAGMFALLAELPSDGTVALVGHEPRMSELLAGLVVAGAAAGLDWRKGGAALVESESHPVRGRSTLRWFLPPRVLRRLAA